MRTLTILATLVATPAIACPTADDLATGIRVTESDDVVGIYKSIKPDLVELRLDFGDGDSGLNHLAQGVYIKRLSSLYQGILDFDSVLLTDYGQDYANIAAPAPGLTQSFKTTIHSFSESYKETQTQSWGPLGDITIGDCTTPAIIGSVVYENEYGSATETIAYLPNIGIGLLTAYADGDADPDLFEPIAIEAVE